MNLTYDTEKLFLPFLPLTFNSPKHSFENWWQGFKSTYLHPTIIGYTTTTGNIELPMGLT